MDLTKIVMLVILGIIILSVIFIAIYSHFESKKMDENWDKAIKGKYQFFLDGIEIDPDNIIKDNYSITFYHHKKKVLLTKPEIYRRY